MHVIEFLANFLFTPDAEIIEARLPDSAADSRHHVFEDPAKTPLASILSGQRKAFLAIR